MAASRKAGLVVLALLLVPLLGTGVGAQDDRLVPQSLWGVKSAVGLGPIGEFLTNHGERPFYQDRPTGDGVRVAIIDTGIDLAHPDLEGALACAHCWKDLVAGRPEPYDDHGHGTHVAGIVAGRGHLQLNPFESYFPTGARGLAPGAGLVVAKAMNGSGSGTDERVAEAVRWAVDPDGRPETPDGAHIVHLSLGVEPAGGVLNAVRPGSKTEEAVREVIDQGVFVVLSAGNQGREEVTAPGGVPGVLAVGALDSRGRVLSFSNTGEGVDVFAPGVITSTWPAALDEDGIDDGYTGLAGTSQAAPVLTGALALLLDADPSLREGGGATKVAHVETLVRRTAETTDAGVLALDADALLAAQDAGGKGVAWTVVGFLAAIALVLVALAARVVLGFLRRNAERQGGKEEERPERAPGPAEPRVPGPAEPKE